MTQAALFDDLPEPGTPHPTEPGDLPNWIAEQLRANKTNATARTARFRHCPKCEAIILTGLDADLLAWTVNADPTPLTEQQETAAIIVGRRTFLATKTTDGYRLDHLDHDDGLPARIGTNPDHLPEHQCGARFPGFIHPPTSNGATNHGYPIDTEPPF